MELVYAAIVVALSAVPVSVVAAFLRAPQPTPLVRKTAQHYGVEIQEVERIAPGAPRMLFAEPEVDGITVTVRPDLIDIEHEGAHGREQRREWRLVVQAPYPIAAGPHFASIEGLARHAEGRDATGLPLDAEVASDGAWVTISMDTRALHSEQVIAAVEVVAAAAGADHYGLSTLRALPGSTWVEDGANSHALLPLAPPVRIRPGARDGVAFTRAAASCATPASWSATLADDGQAVEITGDVPHSLASGYGARLAAAGVRRLAAHDGTLVASWPGVERAEQRLNQAAADLARLANDTGAAYR